MAGMYNTNLLEQGQVIMLDFGKNYNKSSSNQAVNPVSLNRYWLMPVCIFLAYAFAAPWLA